MSFQDTLVDVIDTNATKKPLSPQLKFTNPLKKKIYINSIQLSFDAYFSEKGAILIKINGNPILNKIAGSFKRLENFTVPMNNQEFMQQQKIEIFAWNGIDNDYVSLGYDIQISEDPNALISSDTPMSQNTKNSQISDAIILFENKIYTNEVVNALLDLKGYQKLIVNLSAQTYTSPTIIENDNFGASGYSLDGDLSTTNKDGSGASGLGGDTHHITYDFGSVASRVPKCFCQSHAGISGGIGTSVVTLNLYVSDDNVIFSLIATDTYVGTGSTTSKDLTLQGSEQSFRYMKLEYVWTRTLNVNNANNCGVYEGYDGNALGGTASLSFHELDIGNNSFTELIPSTEFGTVTQGQAVKRQIGDVNNVSLTGKTYFLPSTQTGFRAVLTVTGGGVSTGVSVRRIK